MTTNFFHDCKTEDDIKKKYRELSKKHHPDLGGDEEIMKEINRQYESCRDKPPPPPPNSNDGPKFYGHGFGNYSKYKTYQGQEFANRFKRDSPKYENYGEGIPLDHPIRGLVNQLEERVRGLQNHLNHVMMESNDWQRRYQEELSRKQYNNFNAERYERLNKQYSNLSQENEKINKKYDSLKRRYEKIKSTIPKKTKKRRICATEPNVENVIAL